MVWQLKYARESCGPQRTKSGRAEPHLKTLFLQGRGGGFVGYSILIPVARVPVLVGALVIGQWNQDDCGKNGLNTVARKITTGRLLGCVLLIPCEL